MRLPRKGSLGPSARRDRDEPLLDGHAAERANRFLRNEVAPPTGRHEVFSRDTIAAFKHVLDRARVPATVRLTRGRDIAAACGQLAAERVSV